MIRRLMRLENLPPLLLMMSGVAALGIALGADLVLRKTFHVGTAQLMVLVVGLGMLTVGAGVLVSPASADSRALPMPRLGVVDVRQLARFVAVTLQLGLLVIVIREFRIENPAFYDEIAPLTLAGFVVHHLLPMRHRLPFFLLVSLTGIWMVFGTANAAWLIGIGLALISICHLPAPFYARIAILCLAGALLMVMRAGQVPSPWSAAIWPILGSMFMFRLIVYVYDLRHSKEPQSLPRTLSYFFLLPNVVFPLFPVVDYSTFRRTYYDRDAFVIYQRGLAWMCRGITHLVLYRLVYQYLVIPSSEVATGSDLVRYVVGTFLLYLRVSGQFHLIVGMLHLFGFRLPETHRFFYLASSFTDFWRRINIYWKDFVLKVFYYPTFFWLRPRGNTFALVSSTFVVFFVTWITHSYQWFWILGSWLLSWTDVLFWAILALLLIANSLFEMRHGRVRTLRPGARSAGDIARSALRTALTFAVVSVLWSLWTSPTVGEWISLMGDTRWRATDFVIVVAVLGGVAALAAAYDYRGVSRALPKQDKTEAANAFLPSALATAASLLIFYLIASPTVTDNLGLRAQVVIRDLRVMELNRRDAALLQRGYYERLTGVNRFNGQLWELYAERSLRPLEPEDNLELQPTGDFRHVELRPLIGITFKGQSFRTNRWGMRDRNYELIPPANTFRIALFGASYTMGSGVADGENFESLLEEQLNRTPVPASQRRYEILNFAVSRYGSLHHVHTLEHKALAFGPDAVFLVSHRSDGEVSARHLARMIREGVDVPYPFLLEVARRAGVDARTPEVTAEKRLEPYRVEILAWAYERIADACRERGVQPVWVYIPMPGDDLQAGEIEALSRLAAEAGFTVLGVLDPYAGRPAQEVQLATWDRHPNTLGHRLIARSFFQTLMNRPEVLERRAAAPATVVSAQ